MAFGAGMGPLDFHDESHRGTREENHRLKSAGDCMGYVSF